MIRNGPRIARGVPYFGYRTSHCLPIRTLASDSATIQARFKAVLWEKTLLQNPLDVTSLYFRPGDFVALFQGRFSDLVGASELKGLTLTHAERLDVCAQELPKIFQRIEAERADQLFRNDRVICERILEIGLTETRDYQLEENRNTQGRDTYVHDLRYLISVTLSVVLQAQAALHRCGILSPLLDRQTSKNHRPILFRKDETDPQELTLIIDRYDRTSKIVSLVDAYFEALAKLLKQHQQSKRHFPAGAEFNNIQKKLLEIAEKFVRAANKNLPESERVQLPAVFSDPVGPYHLALPPKPGKLLSGYRQALAFSRFYRVSIFLRSMLKRKTPQLPLLLHPWMLPKEIRWERQVQLRLLTDVLAYIRHALPFSHQQQQYLQALEEGDLRTLAGLRKSCARWINASMNFSPVVQEFSPGAEEMHRSMVSDMGTNIGHILAPMHVSVFDTLLNSEGLPGSRFDEIYQGRLGSVCFIGRKNWLASIPLMDVSGFNHEFAQIFNTVFIPEDKQAAALEIKNLSERMRDVFQSILIYLSGGRESFAHSLVPLMRFGLPGLVEGGPEVITPMAIHDANDYYGGGNPRIIVGRPIRVRDFNKKTRGEPVRDLRELDLPPLLDLIRWEHHFMGHVWVGEDPYAELRNQFTFRWPQAV